MVKIDAERAQYWIGKGAQPRDTVRSLLKKQARRPRRRRPSSGHEGAARGAGAGARRGARAVCASSEWTEDGVVHLDLEVAPDDRGRVIGRGGPHRGRAAHRCSRPWAGAAGSSATWRSWTDGLRGQGLRRPDHDRPVVIKPQGRKGEVLVAAPLRPSGPLPEPAARVRARARRRGARGRPSTRSWPHKGRVVLKLDGRRLDRRGREATAASSSASARTSSTSLPAGSYYHYQLRGLKVEDPAGRPLGVVADVLDTGGERPSWS